MPVYMVIEVTKIVDPDTYAEYQRRVPATVEKYGGRYVVRGGAVVSLTGDWNPARMVVLEFPSMERMTEWNFSSDYLELVPLRTRSTKTRAIALEGFVAGEGA
jgi:uncharacterized protein (DUF1330 family)